MTDKPHTAEGYRRALAEHSMAQLTEVTARRSEHEKQLASMEGEQRRQRDDLAGRHEEELAPIRAEIASLRALEEEIAGYGQQHRIALGEVPPHAPAGPPHTGSMAAVPPIIGDRLAEQRARETAGSAS